MIALDKMIERQEELNVLTMGERWKTLCLDWNVAIITETSELIDSYPWKWWKNGKIDSENAKIELTDIWHFVMSKMIEENVEPTEIIEEKLMLLANSDESEMDDIVEFSKDLLLKVVSGSDAISIAESTMMLSGKIGLPYQELVKIYFGKSVLNDFRQTKGYKDGSYIKDWGGQEDNEVMLRIIKTIPYNSDFYDYLFSTLTEEYMMIES